jgi:hypothetical protein
MKVANIPIFCSPTVARPDATKPVCSYFDISFVENTGTMPPPFHALIFTNYYVSAISCTQHSPSGTETVILDKKQLMTNCACENGAEQVHCIYISEFNSRFKLGLPIRVYLFQPYPYWAAFDLKNVRAVSFAEGVLPPASPAVPKLGTVGDASLSKLFMSLKTFGQSRPPAGPRSVGAIPGNLVSKGKLRKGKSHANNK